jgi:hypothetical protein
MNTKMICRLTLLPLVAAVALLTACSKQSEPAGHSENDGHNHAKTNSPAPDDHTGHNHGPGEATTPPAK